METIKGYTDLEQSKKLAEILPLESADMFYQYILPKSDKIIHNPQIGNPSNSLKWHNKGYVLSGQEQITMDEFCVPCWSLAALLAVLNFPSLTQNKENEWEVCIFDHDNDDYIEKTTSNPIDACVAMIVHLYEFNLL